MWCADNWRDYELLDTSDGERLERWGDYILIRPDPQVIWRGCAASPLWKKANGIYRRSSTWRRLVGKEYDARRVAHWLRRPVALRPATDGL